MIAEAASFPEIKIVSNFPKSKHYLWDKTNVGQATFLHLAHYRKPKVCIPEKVLRLIQHQCEHFEQASHTLIGSLIVDDDGEGVRVQVDRLDTRTNASKDSFVPGDLLIPLKVTNNAVKDTQSTVNDYITVLQTLRDRCCSKSSIELSSFLLCEGFATFYSNAHTSVVHLDLDMVTVEAAFRATPIPVIPIILTALSKNLAGPRSLSKVQGVPKTGYLTMDHTRKLLLVLESDPKATSLPLVGIWISGVEFVQHPFVWASCLRYIHNAHLQDRVHLPPEDFLLVFYTTLHTKPEFYQCNTVSGTQDLNFKLYSGHEVTHIAKAFSNPCENMAEVELGSVYNQRKQEMFDEAVTKYKESRFTSNFATGISEDIEPRCAPVPHMEKVPVFRPVVPDVSVLWAESPVSSHQFTVNSNRFSSESSSVFSPRSPLYGPLLRQGPRCQQVPTSSSLAQQYSPMSQVQFVNYAASPSSHAADTSTINSHISVHSHGRNTFQSNQDNTQVMPKLVGHPSPHCGTSASKPYGPISAFSSSNCVPDFTSRKEPACIDLPGSSQSNIGYSVPTGPSQSNIGYSVPTGYSQSNIGYSVPTGSSQSNIGYSVQTGSSQSNIGHSVPTGSSQSNIGNSAPTTPQLLNSMAFQSKDVISSSLSGHTNSPLFLRNRGVQPVLKTVVEEPPNQPTNHPQEKIPVPSCVDSSASEDSGLSTTPEKSSTQQKEAVSGAGPAGVQSADKLSWDQLPADVRTLLIQQNEQIKLLQQQIQILLQQQTKQDNNNSSLSSRHQDTFQSDRNTSPSDNLVRQGKQLLPEPNQSQDYPASNKAWSNQHVPHNTSQNNLEQMETMQSNQSISTNSSQVQVLPASSTLQVQVLPASSTLQVQVLPANSTSQDCTTVSEGPAEKSTQKLQSAPETNIMKQQESAVVNFHPINSQESSSPKSDTVDDSPYFLAERSDLDQSPISVSQYSCNDQDESYSTLAEDATDPKQYYDQLMNNIQMFLSNTGSSEAEINAEETLQASSTSANGSLAHQISYISMLLGCGADVGQSMEINAMAMKYLKDEQLTQMAKLWKENGYSTNQSNKVLQKVFSGALSGREVSVWGSSPNMTMGTQMYLARHGLLGNDSSVMLTSSNTDQASMLEKFQLKTDFSTLTLGNQDSIRKLPCEVSGFDNNRRPRDQLTPPSSPLCRDFASAQKYANTSANNENWLHKNSKLGGHHKDLGASPVLGVKPYGDTGLRNVLQEVKRQGVQDSARKRLPVASTFSEEDDNLLDIAKLKQLPKLL